MPWYMWIIAALICLLTALDLCRVLREAQEEASKTNRTIERVRALFDEDQTNTDL